MADTETLDRIYLEWSQFTEARTRREIELAARVEELEHAVRDAAITLRNDRYDVRIYNALATLDDVLGG